jgi:hypothetical protein
MDDPIPRTGLRPRYWERVKLKDMTPREWEALCDGCGKCCLNKLEDADTGEVALTRLACRLLDDRTWVLLAGVRLVAALATVHPDVHPLRAVSHRVQHDVAASPGRPD